MIINYYASFFEKKKINISKNANLSIKNFFYVDKEKYNLYTKQCIIPSKARSYNVNNVFIIYNISTIVNSVKNVWKKMYVIIFSAMWIIWRNNNIKDWGDT